jgi:tRNA/rRNA methyltransferase
MTLGVKLDHIAIVLVRPRYSENIGSAARAMRNMGIRRLLVVSPERYDLQRVYRLATHAARDVVDTIALCTDLKTALADFNYVVGTTARLGGERKRIASPGSMAAEVAALSQENQVALLFGPEDRGLSNEDLRLCHALVNIPTAEFSSLNLAQAVMVLCYELFKTRQPASNQTAPRLATRIELDGMYDQVKEMLVRINHIQPGNPDYWMNKLRLFFSRLKLRGGEVSIIRGICRQMDWYAEKRYRDGLADGKGTGADEKAKVD